MTIPAISKGILKIHPKFEEIIIALKSAYGKGNNSYILDEEREDKDAEEDNLLYKEETTGE